MRIRRRQRCFDVSGLQGAVMVTCLLALLVLGCRERPCDLHRIEEVIDRDIEGKGRRVDEFQMERPRRDGRLLYVGMAQRINAFYHHHYWIDPTTCRIVDVKADQ